MHEALVDFGEILGNTFLKNIITKLFRVSSPILRQRIKGIDFENPVGLAAGFDYEAKLTKILPAVGFGFQTIGTITNFPYIGNPRPQLGRLVKSRSLLVNKGFKNQGIDKIVQKFNNKKFQIPVGISIGQTNTDKFSQQNAVEDIISAFKKAEKGNLNSAYYELNISCPNLNSNVNFYDPKNLDHLLKSVKKLNIKKPIFIKMPIDKSDSQTTAMLKVIVENKFDGVIFGNLQKDRNNFVLDKEEVKKYPVGNFSGKPTWERSNQLIELAYENFKDKLIIIGCGGIFSARDAYTKIKLGANLVQFITGLIFEGPQLAAEINQDLLGLLKKDGFENISQAVGKS